MCELVLILFSVASADLEVFNQALQVYNTYTCVKFRPAKGKDSTRLVIKDGDGCASYIGMKQEMREQTLFLAEKCRYVSDKNVLVALMIIMHWLRLFYDR